MRKVRESTSAILLSVDGRLLLQQRDDIPNIPDPGKISLFGGGREEGESFLGCIVREIGYYVPADSFKLIARYVGPHYSVQNTDIWAELFVARGIPIESPVIAKGTLLVVALHEIDKIRDRIPAPVQCLLKLSQALRQLMPTAQRTAL